MSKLKGAHDEGLYASHQQWTLVRKGEEESAGSTHSSLFSLVGTLDIFFFFGLKYIFENIGSPPTTWTVPLMFFFSLFKLRIIHVYH